MRKYVVKPVIVIKKEEIDYCDFMNGILMRRCFTDRYIGEENFPISI